MIKEIRKAAEALGTTIHDHLVPLGTTIHDHLVIGHKASFRSLGLLTWRSGEGRLRTRIDTQAMLNF